ncbi:MAG: patatin-like phospholipase family protein [Chloroflexi bacterium]|nr:MAG: patatin-like phospholipase family protein [Chloroflexota bacterium]
MGKTAFVFAGGGSLGSVEVGMLRALVQSGVQADFVVGSSVGAINAVQFAADPTPAGIERLKRIWRTVRREDVFPVSPLGAMLRLLTRRGHLVAQAALCRLLKRHLTVRQLEDTVLPCHVITTDLLGGTEVRLSAGPAVDALLASTAIPGIFQPVWRAGRHLVDGGVTSNTPIATAIELGASRVIVLPTGVACALDAPPRGMVAVALHALTLLIARQLVSDVERLRDRAEMVVVPPLCPLAVSSYDFSRGGELIDRAAESTARWLDGGGLRIPSMAGPLQPHHH